MRWRLALAAAVLAAVAAGLVAWGAAPPEPPGLTAASGGQPIEVRRGSYCWRGPLSGRCIDTWAPRELVQGLEPARVGPGATVEFRFGREPDQVAVYLWAEGEPQEVPVTGERAFTAPQEPGTYVYSIFGRWNRRGDGTYAFTIQVEAR